MKRLWVALILILAFLGIANSAYLAQSALGNEPLLCNVSGLSGCNTVAQSPYSALFGIPLGLYGVAFYAGVFILAAVELLLFRPYLRRLLQVGALVGLLASVIFTVIQKFLIQAFCIYCILSALIALLIFVFATLIEPVKRPRRRSAPVITPPPRPPHLLMPPR